MIKAAWRWAERETNRCFLTTTWLCELELRSLPAGPLSGSIGKRSLEIWLPRPPIQSVSAIQYQEDYDAWTAVTESYYLNTVMGTVTPETYWDANRLRVTYVAGYGADHKNVPDNIQQGLFRLIANLYDHRSDLARFGGQGSLPFDAASFLDQERVLYL